MGRSVTGAQEPKMLKWIVLSLIGVAVVLLTVVGVNGALNWSDFAVSLSSNLAAAAVVVGGVDVLRRRSDESTNRLFVQRAFNRPISFIVSFTGQLVRLFEDDHDQSRCLQRCQEYLDEAAAEIEGGSGFLARGVDGDTWVALHALVQDVRRLAQSARAILKDDGTQLEIMTPQMVRILQNVQIIETHWPDAKELKAKLDEAEAILRKHGRV